MFYRLKKNFWKKWFAKGIAVDIRQVPSDKKVAVEDVL